MVLAVAGRVLPTLNSAIWIWIFAPTVTLLPLLLFHRAWRSVTYIITTERVLIVEPQGVVDEIRLGEISKVRTSRASMMIYGQHRRFWLSRLPDGVFFASVIRNVTQAVARQSER